MPANDQATAILPGLSPICGRQIEANFNGGLMSSDGGLLVLRKVEQRLGIGRRLAAWVQDPRAPERIVYGLDEIIRFRMLMIAAGNEDGNDTDALRSDPLFKLAMDRLPEHGDLRGAIVVGATIPFAFFVAVITMLLRGESANLLSLGSLDFGLLVDATVILVENVYRHLHLHKAQFRSGRMPHPATASRGLSGVPLIVLRASGEVSTVIFFSALIIVAAFIPLFTMGGIEGRIFGPMAKTYAYAIGGALLATFTVAPALAGALFKDETEEKIMPLVRWLSRAHEWLHALAMRRRLATLGVSGVLLLVAVLQFGRMGGEFLPTLEEGSIWMRATMPATISFTEGNAAVNRMRTIMMEFPEVITITSQQGRPDDGTDSAGFFNAEFFVPLKPMEEWTTARNKDALISIIQARLAREFIGVDFNFSQYISDNVQEASSGVKGANALKVIGPELDVLARLAEQRKRSFETLRTGA